MTPGLLGVLVDGYVSSGRRDDVLWVLDAARRGDLVEQPDAGLSTAETDEFPPIPLYLWEIADDLLARGYLVHDHTHPNAAQLRRGRCVAVELSTTGRALLTALEAL